MAETSNPAFDRWVRAAKQRARAESKPTVADPKAWRTEDEPRRLEAEEYDATLDADEPGLVLCGCPCEHTYYFECDRDACLNWEADRG